MIQGAAHVVEHVLEGSSVAARSRAKKARSDNQEVKFPFSQSRSTNPFFYSPLL